MKLIKEREKAKKESYERSKIYADVYRENPLTAEIMGKEDLRLRKSRDINREFSAINSEIIQLKYANSNRMPKSINNAEEELEVDLPKEAKFKE
jgi:hypothetical protein